MYPFLGPMDGGSGAGASRLWDNRRRPPGRDRHRGGDGKLPGYLQATFLAWPILPG